MALVRRGAVVVAACLTFQLSFGLRVGGGASLQTDRAFTRFLGLGKSWSEALGACEGLTNTSRDFPLDPHVFPLLCAAPKELQHLVQSLLTSNEALKKQTVEVRQPDIASTQPLWKGPPPPPPCSLPPETIDRASVSLGLAPFKPVGAVGNASTSKDGALVWKLDTGGWAFQYPDMLANVQPDGRTLMAWATPGYAVEMHPEGRVTYRVGDTVVHRTAQGRVVFHRPAGTIHQAGSTLIYHWCNPNLIIYRTPAGVVYYDNDGMTYSGAGVAHYSPSGEVLYQGTDGVTHLYPNGALTHWTSSGAIYRHANGVTYYTPTGESTPEVLPTDALGPDPFPGPPLSMQEVMRLAAQASPNSVVPQPAAWPQPVQPWQPAPQAGGGPPPPPPQPGAVTVTVNPRYPAAGPVSLTAAKGRAVASSGPTETPDLLGAPPPIPAALLNVGT